jgi:hypothetical protein
MTNQELLFEKEGTLVLNEVESGFDVVNYNDFKGKDIQRLAHMPNKKTNEKIGVTKEEFEAQVKKCYGIKNIEWVKKLEDVEEENYDGDIEKFDEEEEEIAEKNEERDKNFKANKEKQNALFKEEKIPKKFKAETSRFILEGIEITYKLEVDYITDYHFEFRSEKPNLISETGYRSDFPFKENVESYNSIPEYLTDYIKFLAKEKKIKNYELKFLQDVKPTIQTDTPECIIQNTPNFQQLNNANKTAEIPKWKEYEEKDIECCYWNIDLKGSLLTEQELTCSSTHKKPKGQMGSSWGCGGTLPKENEALLTYFLDFFKEIAKTPYADFDSPFTTTLRVKNCWIDMSKEAINYLTKRGFDFQKLDIEERKIKESQVEATPEIITKAKTFELMEKAMSKLRDECWAIKSYFENFLNRRKKLEKNPYHIQQLMKFGLLEATKDLNKLIEIYEQKANVYHTYYMKVNEQRWGKKPDEEYSYI